MNCQQTQELFDDLARARLEMATAQAVRDHLADCSDCRVAHQRTVRLQRLLQLKRYEQPAAAELDSLRAGIRRRLAAESDARSPLDRILASLGLDSFLAVRYGWPSAVAAVLVVGLVWVALLNSREAAFQSGFVNVVASPSVNPVRTPAAQSSPAAAWPAAATHILPSIELPAIEFSSAQPMLTGPSSPPRYVLDRIVVTPASYETASIDF